MHINAKMLNDMPVIDVDIARNRLDRIREEKIDAVTNLFVI